MNPWFWALCSGAILVLLLTAGVWLASWVRTKQVPDSGDMLREPLGIPRGSVRSMLGLLIVGGFVDFLLFAWPAFGQNTQLFSTVVSTFATLTGAVTGFYFGHRAAQGPSPRPDGAQARASATGRAKNGGANASKGKGQDKPS